MAGQKNSVVVSGQLLLVFLGLLLTGAQCSVHARLPILNERAVFINDQYVREDYVDSSASRTVFYMTLPKSERVCSSLIKNYWPICVYCVGTFCSGIDRADLIKVSYIGDEADCVPTMKITSTPTSMNSCPSHYRSVVMTLTRPEV